MLRGSGNSRLLVLGATALACLLFAPLAKAGWLPPVDVSAAGEHIGGSRVVLDSAGNATAVWDRWDGASKVVESAYREAGSGWQSPIVLSELESQGEEEAAGAQNASSPRIAVDGEGGATVVWERYGGANRLLIQATYRPPGGSWQAPVDIGEVTTMVAPEPWVAVDAAGDATAVWKNREVIESAYRPAGGSWQAPAPISDPETESFTPQAAVNAQGDATAVWMHFDGSDYVVQSAYRPTGGSWGAPTLVSAPGEEGGNPHIALDGSGNAMVVWRGEGEGGEAARAAYKSAGGEWQAPVDVSTPGEEAQSLRVALDADGDAMVLWGGSTGELGAHAVVQAAYRPAGGGWEAPIDISEDGGNAYPSDVAFDADGNAAVVWARSDGTQNVVQAAYKPAGQPWEAPTDLSEEGKNAMDAVVVLGAPGISSAARGVATALWTSAEEEGACGEEKEPACFSYTVQAAGYDGFEAPSETLEVPEEGVVGAPVEISVPPENIWSPKIEFGDGASADSTSATHTYAAPGEYTVTFSGTEVLGYESSAQRTILIDEGAAPSGDKSPAQAEPPSQSSAAVGKPICPGAKAARERALRRFRSGGASRKHAAALRKAKRRLAYCVARHTG